MSFVTKSLQSRVGESDLQDYKLYAQSKDNESIYKLMEKMKSIEINSEVEKENIFNDDKQKDMTIRFWKLKKRAKPAVKFYQSTTEDEDELEDSMTPEEIQEKRMEIEERKKSNMPLEKKYQSQIGQLELKMRNMRKK